jgi:hypothetical protein
MRNGGWTLIMATNSLGPDFQTQASSVTPGSGTYLPLATVQALANIGTQVHLRSPGALATRSLTSVASALAIQNLRAGLVLNYNSPLASDTDDPSMLWTGPLATDSRFLWHTCGFAPWGGGTPMYPTLYWACNNGNGAHITGDASTFSLSAGASEPIEIYVR